MKKAKNLRKDDKLIINFIDKLSKKGMIDMSPVMKWAIALITLFLILLIYLKLRSRGDTYTTTMTDYIKGGT